MHTLIVVELLACAALAISGCSFVKFEQSPYTPRDLDVVYSVQEDLTFLSWKVDEEADVDQARFQVYRDGEYRAIDLARAPYPAEPYACGKDELCLQFQFEGRLEVSEDTPPLRTLHEEVWGGPTATVHVEERTFGVEPFAIDKNRAIDPGLFDWFSRYGVPLRRDYQFQLIDHAAECADVDSAAWRALRTPTAVAYEWVERSVCYAARPRRRDRSGPVIKVPLSPSAETEHDRQVYRPPEEQSPIVYGVLLDLQIADANRCQTITTSLLEMIAQAFEARGETELLDVYLPLSSRTGESIETCDQQPGRYYPTDRMLHDAQITAALHDPKGVRVVWIYVNNSQIPPSQELIDELPSLSADSQAPPNLDFFAWGIGSNSILARSLWDARTGWRPIDDDTFGADIVSFADNTLPFTTMMHFPQTEVSIQKPANAGAPRYFKICTAQPHYSAIGDTPGEPPTFGPTSPAVPWPSGPSTAPFYTVDLGEQRMVPFNEFRRHRVETVVEVCERFCDHGFRTGGGVAHDNWLSPAVSRPQEACQWTR